MAPPTWVTAATAVAWAAATFIAAVTTIVLPSCRRSPWVAVWPPMTVAAGWWAHLNVSRWAGEIDTDAYRTAVAPLVPALFVLWAWTAAVYVVRAYRTDRLESSISNAIHDGRKRYEDGE